MTKGSKTYQDMTNLFRKTMVMTSFECYMHIFDKLLHIWSVSVPHKYFETQNLSCQANI